MSQSKPTDIEVDTYAKEYIKHGDQTKSWNATFPTSKAAPETKHVKASIFHSINKVQVRIGKVQVKAAEVAEKKFTITIEQRLRWLTKIIDAGMGTYKDMAGNDRLENLAAAKGAIETLNNMLGTDEASGTVKPVKVFIGVKDASRPKPTPE